MTIPLLFRTIQIPDPYNCHGISHSLRPNSCMYTLNEYMAAHSFMGYREAVS